ELGEVEHGDLAILLLQLLTALRPGIAGSAFENVPDRPRVRRDTGQLLLLAECLCRGGRRRQSQMSRADPGAAGDQKSASSSFIHMFFLIRRARRPKWTSS